MAFGASALTLISGFGLGTLLLPAFALLFPPEIAVAATAIVHLLNNIFKVFLVGKYADRSIVLKFAPGAFLAALAGAWLLLLFAALPGIFSYELGGAIMEITPVGLSVGLLILLFAVTDLGGTGWRQIFAGRYVLGGLISGFFGGLSGHQGALRSSVLIHAGLDKRAYVGTGTMIAIVIDVARLLTYGLAGGLLVSGSRASEMGSLVLAAMAAAFAGALIGKRLMDKITLKVLHKVVGILLILTGTGLATGLI